MEETTVEKYVRRERERKQKRKEKLKNTQGASPADADGQNMNEQAQDLGFDDPFFAAPENGKLSSSKMRKEERLKKRAEGEAEEAANAAKRAELELLMVDDKDTEIKHFDMNEIEKAERRARKKGKHRRDKSLLEDNMDKDDFKMDTKDPRFASRLFENHEFAIDPTNSKFKGTSGMKALLDEGRRRRERHNSDPEHKSDEKHEKSLSKGMSPIGGEEVKELVQKLKKKKHT
jgi:hypothetical protein